MNAADEADITFALQVRTQYILASYNSAFPLCYILVISFSLLMITSLCLNREFVSLGTVFSSYVQRIWTPDFSYA